MPFEIPENWVWTTIEDIAESNIGLTYKPTDICANGVPVYRSNNIQNRRICLKELVRVNTNILEKQYLQEGDLLICARNGSRNLVGKCAIVDNLNEPTSFGAFMAVCRSALNPWIFQILNSEYFNTYLDDSNSTAINQVTQKMLLAFQLPIPPAAEQERIISKLKQWYEYIDEIEDRKIELESYIKQTKSKILDLAISGKLVPQDTNDEPAIELLKRINPDFQPCDNSHYENLPQGWTIVGLHSVAEIITGSTPSKLNAEYYNGDVPFYKPNDLDQGRHVRYASEYLSQQGKSISRSIPCNSIAVCCIGSIGKCGFIEKEGVTNQQINTIVPNDAIFPLYMYYFCNSSTFIDELKSLSSAVTISIVNKSKLSTIQIPLPPIAEQKRIISVIEKLYSHLDMITAEL